MKKRRQYQRTAALLGAQPHVQSLHRKKRVWPRLSWKVIVPLILVLAVILWFLIDDRWYLLGENIQILGTTSAELAREVALASDLLGWHGLLLRPQAAQARILEKVPGVTEAETTCRRLPAQCVIDVVERTPVLVWQTDTVIYCADAQGLLFRAKAEYPELPLVRGPLPDGEDAGISGDIFQGVEALIALGIPAQSFEYQPRRGLIWVDNEGRRVAFGTGSDMAARWQVYEALVAHLEAKRVFPWVIDVRFPDGATYSMERSW